MHLDSDIISIVDLASQHYAGIDFQLSKGTMLIQSRLLDIVKPFEYDSPDLPIVLCILCAPKTVRQSLGIIEDGGNENDWNTLMKLKTIVSRQEIMFLLEVLSILYHLKRLKIVYNDSNALS